MDLLSDDSSTSRGGTRLPERDSGDFVLVNIEPGKDRHVGEMIAAMPEVKEALQLFGEYDLILRVEVRNFDELDRFIFDVLRTIDGVTSTKTLVATRKLK